MKLKIFVGLVTLALLFVGIAPSSALADAYEASFTTSITYQNVGNAATQTLDILFYDSPADTSPIQISRPNLSKGAGTSVFVGSIGSINAGFQGTAVMSSDQPLAATGVQVPQSAPTVKAYPLSNGFSSGSQVSLIPSVIKNTFNHHTLFSVQNATSSSFQVTIKFIDTNAATVHTITQTLQGGAGYHVDAGQLSQLGSAFNGSVKIETPGPSNLIVSSAMELEFGAGRVGAKAFEGIGAGATKLYMPSAACQYSGMSSSYAVQNTNLSQSTFVTVTYSNGATQSATVGPGAKASFIACNNLPSGYLGSAVITSTVPGNPGSPGTDIAALGKISGNGASTAYGGFSSGSQKVALPYIRWGNDFHFFTGALPRSNIAIQNVGNSTITADILVRYVDRNGNIVGTHTISTDVAPEGKVNSNAANAGLVEFGCYNNCTEYGGSVIVEAPAGSQLAVIARNSVYYNSLYFSEDYSGIPTSLVLP